VRDFILFFTLKMRFRACYVTSRRQDIKNQKPSCIEFRSWQSYLEKCILILLYLMKLTIFTFQS